MADINKNTFAILVNVNDANDGLTEVLLNTSILLELRRFSDIERGLIGKPDVTSIYTKLVDNLLYGIPIEGSFDADVSALKKYIYTYETNTTGDADSITLNASVEELKKHIKNTNNNINTYVSADIVFSTQSILVDSSFKTKFMSQYENLLSCPALADKLKNKVNKSSFFSGFGSRTAPTPTPTTGGRKKTSKRHHKN